eukprot:TRINITY_DN21779_c0_g1_i1.p1 TRINITY_DN21779_c0_g1~~TRINITY_DN21779_c0_g1_i1.p1  ORF type:complete len:395 (-),score=189.83 TRINITY_DN21779_c0_g1_i1:312-1427(-)
MAPTKAAATKRQAQEAKGQKAAKKPRTDPMLQAVIDCVAGSSDLSADCIAMVTSMLPHSLGLATDKRGPHQTRVVGMAKEILEAAQKKLQATIEAETSKLAQVESGKAEIDGKAAAAEAAAKAAEEAYAGKKAAVSERQGELGKAEETLKTAKKEQETGDAELVEAEKKLAELKAVAEKDLKALASEEDFKAEDAPAHCQALLGALKSCAVDESLSKSLPTSCVKAPAERGAFDKIALEQVEKILNDKIEGLSKTLAEGASGKEARAQAVADAEKAVTEASEAKKGAADALLDSEVEKANAAEGLRSAKAALADHEPAKTAAEEAVNSAKEALSHFEQYTLACFETLEKKVTPPEKPVEAVTTIEAVSLGA